MEKPALYDELSVEGFINWDNAEIFKDVIETVNPKSILEIGFYRGASSFFWLYLSSAKLLSVDSMRWEGCSIENVRKLINRFPDRFSFICESSQTVHNKLFHQHFDLLYIDGGHTSDIVINDIQLGIDLEIEYLFLDDLCPNIFRLLRVLTESKYEIKKMYDRKTTNEWIHMALVQKIKRQPEDVLLYDTIKKWERIFNEKEVEIPTLWGKLKRRLTLSAQRITKR